MRSHLNTDTPLARSGEFDPLRIGPLRVDPPVVLAPMAGVTNPPFRQICRSYGAGLYVAEMVSARALVMGNAATRWMASFAPGEEPRSSQLYATEPETAAAASRVLIEELGAQHLDLNFGCPVRKVTAAGGGAALALKPRLLARIVRAAVSAAGAVPVTIKVRKGIDEDLLTYRASGRVAQEEGCAAIGLHARTAAELYSGAADWEAIADLKSRVSIPVLGNGDIWEAFDALRLMRSSGCDGVIIGRGCLGRPWLFRELACVFAGREPPDPPRLGEVTELLLAHARALVAHMGLHAGMRNMRKWCAWYTKGFRATSALRQRLARVETIEELERELGVLDPQLPFPPHALRVRRCKGARRQKVSLPPGHLEELDETLAPVAPTCAGDAAAWEEEAQGG